MLIILVCVVLIIVYCVLFVRDRHNYFKCNNVPGPDITYLFGHLNILCSVTSYSRQLQYWTEQFGEIYGIFEGAQPVWISSNVEFLQEIYVKHFSCFNTRKPEMLTRNTDNSVVHLFDAKGSTWKRQRYAFISLFTPVKLQRTSIATYAYIDYFLTTLHQKLNNNREFDIIPLYQELAFSIGCRQVFGDDDMGMIENYRIYLSKCKGISLNINQGFLAKLDSIFPELTTIFSYCFMLQNSVRAQLNRWFCRHETVNLFREQPAFWLMGCIRRIVKNEDLINRNSNSVLESFRAISKNHQVSA